jgi:hypothetical protein
MSNGQRRLLALEKPHQMGAWHSGWLQRRSGATLASSSSRASSG